MFRGKLNIGTDVYRCRLISKQPMFDPISGAPISSGEKMASREFAGGADIAGACKRVGGHARSVNNRTKIDGENCFNSIRFFVFLQKADVRST